MGVEAAPNDDKVSADNVDARTVFVRSLPFAITDAQLEEVFCEVGPVRHCFTVKDKGSEKHRGFGFVQFAVIEDAQKAVSEKNGALLLGRKIKVELAKRRAPVDQRRPPKTEDTQVKLEKNGSCDKRSTPQNKDKLDTRNATLSKSKKTKRKLAEFENDLVPGVVVEDNEEKKKPKHGSESQNNGPVDQKGQNEEGSSKQRPARTVVIGGLVNSEMMEAVVAEAHKLGTIESVQKSLSEYELSSRGLTKDGCKPRAAALVFLSVKAAYQAVASLHQKEIGGGVVWARQLGGEGSKLKKWRLIVRNLPFQVTESMLREFFAPAGFLWEVTIPRKPDNLSKGFAFVGFTNKVDAEKAIKTMNGKEVGKRPVTVGWAVAKKEFETGKLVGENGPTVAETWEKSVPAVADDGNKDESPSYNKNLKSEESDIVQREKSAGEFENPKGKKRRRKDLDSDKESEHERILIPGHEDQDSMKSPAADEIDRAKEVGLFQKVLQKVLLSAFDDSQALDGKLKKTVISNSVQEEPPYAQESPSCSGKKRSAPSPVTNGTEALTNTKESKLLNTVFIRDLPVDAKVPELRRLFSEFGEVKSFRLVFNPVTKKPKGTAFLEFANQEAAEAAVAAAKITQENQTGLCFKGCAVIVNMAVDRDSARDISKELSKKQFQEDRRNLALVKEGLIQDGMPAAAGVSKKDLMKRKLLEKEKSTKLQSPNFHVSRTRLSVHNVPKTMTEKSLKKLFLDSVLSRATKQHPVIKQVKILKDDDSGESRGAAFVEFTEHQHALVALRVLNNNPDTFGSESRPIVEFAIENSLILRKRAAIAENAKNRNTLKMHGKKSVGTNEHHGRKSRADKQEEFQNGTSVVMATKGKGAKKILKMGANKDNKKVSPKDTEKDSQQTPIREVRGWKKRKIELKLKQNSCDESKAMESGKVLRATGKKPSRNFQSSTVGALGGQKYKQHTEDGQNSTGKLKPPHGHVEKSPRSRDQTQTEKRAQGRRKSAGDAEDNLDRLVAEYRAKLFSGVGKQLGSDGRSIAGGDLQRWFE